MARITSLTQKYKLLADDFEDTDGATDGSKRINVFDRHGQFRNALAPRGGISFDGTSNSHIFNPTFNQSILTDPFSVVVTFKCPTSISSDQGLCIIGAD